MGELQMKRDALERPGLGRKLCCIAIIGLVLAGGFGLVISAVVPDVLRDDLTFSETPIPGSVGSTTALLDSISRTNFVLLNDSSFSPDSDWSIDYLEMNSYSSQFKRQSGDSGTRFDVSNIALFCSYDTNINLHDYDIVKCSVDATALRGPVEVVLNLDVESFFEYLSPVEYNDSLALTSGESGTLNVELEVGALKTMWSHLWLTQCILTLQIYPGSSNRITWSTADFAASVHVENVNFTATSIVPLAPLVIDVQDTQGQSAYNSIDILNTIDTPAINLTSDNHPNEWGIFLPWRANDTIYASTGNYSGAAGIYGYEYAFNVYPVSFEVLPNTSLQLGLRFELVRVRLTVSPPVPYLRLVMSYDDRFWIDYGVEVAPPFSESLCIPKRSANLSVIIETPSRIEDAQSPSINEIHIEVTQPLTIDLRLHVALFSFGGILISAAEILLIFLGLALLIGAVISTQEPNRKIHFKQLIRDPRFWPILLIVLSAFLPWFTSSMTLQWYAWASGGVVQVHKGLYAPFACVLENTANSLSLLVVSSNFIVEALTRIILFWLPLRASIGHIGKPGKWNFNFDYTIYLLSPLFMGVMIFIFTPLFHTLSIGFFVVLAASILWVLELLIYRILLRKNK